jgi:hypothetical protein
MLQELLRRRKSPAFILRINRWTSWAARIVARFSPIRMRGGFVGMRLRESAAPVLSSVENQVSQVTQIFPRVTLSVAPASLLSGKTTISIAPRVNLAIAQIMGVAAAQSATLPLGHSRSLVMQPYALGQKITSLREEAPERKYQAVETNQITTVFRRLFLDQSMTAILRRQSVTGESRETLDRVFRNIRTEDTTFAARTITLQKPASAVTITPAANTATARQAKAGYDSNSTAGARSESHRPPNIDHLADEVIRQLDRKLLSHRERMGTVF